MSDILTTIIEHKRGEIEALRAVAERAGWESQARSLPPPPSFLDALRGFSRIRVIAEIKRASPSAGILRPNFDPVAIAHSYARHGAACLSVLTDANFFGGSIDHLRAIASNVTLPRLRKDFVLEPLQVFEARLAGASAVLLIAECLPTDCLAEMVALIESLHMTALVELHEPTNLAAVLASGAKLIGINNRNLKTFQTDLRHTLDLLGDIPRERTVVSESGIKTREDVARLQKSGVHAILVGEAFMRAPDPGVKLAELLGECST
jgi:indole-3-glycerol phosphate synthase